MNMRLMLLGGGNALGQALIRLGAEEDIGFLAPRPPQQGWDSASLTRLLDETRPEVVVNLAYYRDWFQTEDVDVQRLTEQQHAVERLAGLCKHHGIILLQPSSYCVFDGVRAMPYSEKDEVQPRTPRGKALWQIEQQVRAICSKHVLVRFGWLLDDSTDGHLARFLQLAQERETLQLADDRRGCPTPVDDAARVLLAIIKQLDCAAPLWGTYHYGGMEATTPQLLAQALLQEARAFRPLCLQDVGAQAHAVCADHASEPQNAVLACRKILNTFGIKPRAWRSGLRSLIDRYYRHL
jgi:dTDP-4-dehydrorhamnose reductase